MVCVWLLAAPRAGSSGGTGSSSSGDESSSDDEETEVGGVPRVLPPPSALPAASDPVSAVLPATPPVDAGRWPQLTASLSTWSDAAAYVADGSFRGMLVGFLGRAAFTLLPATVRAIVKAPKAAARAAAAAAQASPGAARVGGGALSQVLRSVGSSASRNAGTMARYGVCIGAVVGVLRACVARDVIERKSGAKAATHPTDTNAKKREEARMRRVGLTSAACGGAALAAALAVLPGGGNESLRTPLALFTAVRALEAGVVAAAQSGFLPNIPHADTLLMMAASAQVCYAWVFRPETLPPHYLSFMDRHGGKPRFIVDAVAEVHRPVYDQADLSRVVEYHNHSIAAATAQLERAGATHLAPRPVNYEAVPSHLLSCSISHPGRSCINEFVTYFVRGVFMAVRVYLPVYALPLILFSRQSLLKDPVGTLLRSVRGVLRSSAFLSAYCAQAWLAVCCMRRWFGIVDGYITGPMAGLWGGAAVIYEKQGRRIELALYVLSQAFDSVVRMARVDGWASRAWPTSRIDGSCVLFGTSVAALLNVYLSKPEVLRPGYLRILDFAL